MSVDRDEDAFMEKEISVLTHSIISLLLIRTLVKLALKLILKPSSLMLFAAQLIP